VRAVPLVVLVAVTTFIVLHRSRRDSDSNAHSGARAASPDSANASAAGSVAMPLRAMAFDGDAHVPSHAASMLHGDASHTHRAHGNGPRTAKATWTFDVGGPVEAQVTTSPDEKTLYVASLGGNLTALTRDGHLKWKVALGDRAYGTPCVGGDGMVYEGSDAKKFFAITSDGRIAWKLETDGDADTSAVVSRDGNVVFAAGNDVFSVRPGGDIAWRFHAKKKVFTSPAITSNGIVIVGSQDHHVYAIAPSGELMWSVDLGSDVDGSASISDSGAIYVGDDAGEVVRLDESGEIVWRTSVGGYVRGALSVARNGDVLVGTYGPAPRVVRLDSNGRIVGTFAIQGTGAREFGIHGAPLEDDSGALFFGAQDDRVYAIGAQGEVLWTYENGADVDAPLTLLADGSLVFGSDEGKVTMLGP
jgi:hypothetical protein